MTRVERPTRSAAVRRRPLRQGPALRTSRLRAQDRTQADDDRETHLRRLIASGIAMGGERDRSVLIERILIEAKTLAQADGGTLYLYDEPSETLRFAILHNVPVYLRFDLFFKVFLF